ncbi:hypothetical protein FACS189472_13950 [Alphaproteobacteria bacterium]|nr:hypothetical protein FACS189472_13950 [Alphaproteobacteria bacterium]
MCKVNRIIKVVCEGRSESAYLNQINRFLKENSIKIIFSPVSTDGGHFNVIKKKLQELGYLKKKTAYQNRELIIWVDKDVYERNEQKNKDKYEDFIQKYPLLTFCFNRFSFEDFYILHFDAETVIKWYDLCRKKGHFNVPIESKVCENLILGIVSNYEKGDISSEFINKDSLKNLLENNKKYEFESGIVDILKPILNTILC